MTTTAAESGVPAKPNFFQKCLNWVENIFDEVPTVEQNIARFADEVTDKIKALEPTAEAIAKFLGSELVPIAEAIDPALTPMISGIELEIPKIINTVTNVTNAEAVVSGELDKPENEQVADGLTALQNLKGVKGTVYSGIMGTIATAISGYVTANNGIVATDADLISTQQAVHAQAAV